MNILFISFEQFPNGSASAQRLIGYYNSITLFGYKAYLLLLTQQKDRLFEKNKIITYNNIVFDNSVYEEKESKISILGKIQQKLHDLKNQFDVVHIYGITGNRLLQYYPVLKYAKKKNYVIIHEQTEFPFINREKKNKIRFHLYIFLYKKLILKNIDGVIVISQALKSIFTNFTNKPIKIVNMFVETDRFSKHSLPSPFKFPYIAYAGSMYSDKDGVYDLIEAFKLIEKKFPKYRLVLMGNNINVKKMKSINQSINTNIKDKLIFTGYVDRNEISRYLQNASLLCLSRPNNKQAKYGFPTKLGEYLMTGIPVVVTNVGEISLYLQDGKSAYIANPDNPKNFADKMELALKNPLTAGHIGKQGAIVASTSFNSDIETKKLLCFLNSLNLN